MILLKAMAFPFFSSLSFKNSVKGGGQKESRSRKNSEDLPASEYYKIYQQTKQHNKQKYSFSDNESLQTSPTTRKRNDSDFSTDSDYSTHTDNTFPNRTKVEPSSKVKPNSADKMEKTTNRVPDIKVQGGGIKDRSVI